MIYLKNNSEIEKLYCAGQIVKETLLMLEEFIVPGVTTLDLDKMAEEFIRSKNSEPGFKGLYGFPFTLCTSIDEEVVHGMPSSRKLQEGEIIGIDVGSIYEGYYGDHAKTFSVGTVSTSKKELLQVTKDSLYLGIKEAKVGNTIGDIGFAIQQFAEKKGFGVVKDLVGHGIGKKLHEEPQVPNFGLKGSGPKIEAGLCLAIEPMINIGTDEVYTKDDDWTICTKDNKPSAHFEHSIAIMENEIKILSE
jgi:methionyl aminopeptidase